MAKREKALSIVTDKDKEFVALALAYGDKIKAAQEAYGIERRADAILKANRVLQEPAIAHLLESQLEIREDEIKALARKGLKQLNNTLDISITDIVDLETLSVKPDIDTDKLSSLEKLDIGVDSEGNRYIKSVKLPSKLQATKMALDMAGMSKKKQEVNVNVSISQSINSEVVSDDEVEAFLNNYSKKLPEAIDVEVEGND